MFKDSGLKDKTIIVTGGSRGIGRAITQLLAEEGADVTFFYNLSHNQAREFETESRENGLNVTATQVDVKDKTKCDDTIQEIADTKGRIDILVNNSGIVRDNLLAGLSEEEIRLVLDTNIAGVFNMTQAVVPTMMRQRAGKIINLSSIAGSKPGRGQSNYAASKGAINAFTKAMAVELAPRNIRVNAVAPGVVETDMSKTVRELGQEEALSKILLKRFAQPEEIAYAVAFLASKYADYITGEILYVDGGTKMA